MKEKEMISDIIRAIPGGNTVMAIGKLGIWGGIGYIANKLTGGAIWRGIKSGLNWVKDKITEKFPALGWVINPAQRVRETANVVRNTVGAVRRDIGDWFTRDAPEKSIKALQELQRLPCMEDRQAELADCIGILNKAENPTDTPEEYETALKTAGPVVDEGLALVNELIAEKEENRGLVGRAEGWANEQIAEHPRLSWLFPGPRAIIGWRNSEDIDLLEVREKLEDAREAIREEASSLGVSLNSMAKAPPVEEEEIAMANPRQEFAEVAKEAEIEEVSALTKAQREAAGNSVLKNTGQTNKSPKPSLSEPAPTMG